MREPPFRQRPRESPRKTPDPYLLVWASWRRRRITVCGVLLAWVTVIALLRTQHAPSDVTIFVASFGLAFFAWSQVRTFDCPGCGLDFEKKVADAKQLEIVLPIRCVHCGLRRGTSMASEVARLEREAAYARVEDLLHVPTADSEHGQVARSLRGESDKRG